MNDLTAIFLSTGKNAKEVNRGKIQDGLKSEIVAGEHDVNNRLDKATVHPVEKVTAHPKYRDSINDGIKYDFAILTLKDPIDLSGKSNARAACLPDPTDTDFSDHPFFDVSGWGKTNGLDNESASPVLKRTKLKWASCQPWGAKNGPHIICAKDNKKGSDSCQGDSGGMIMILLLSIFTRLRLE